MVDTLTPPDYWVDLYRQRWTWGYRMLSKFREEMRTPEFANIFGDDKSETSRVVVFGRTRVGKTTLIFKLLGIDEREFHDGETKLTRLGRILRGNTAKEEAGTSTAVIYRRSVDVNFYLRREGSEKIGPYDDYGIESCLQQLRNDVESGKFFGHEPVIIEIPQQYFDQHGAHRNLTVIDIPGTDSFIQAEQEHVNNLLHKIVQFATMILLVETANSVESLLHREIPGLGNWLHFQSRIRLILTYAVSDNSSLERIRSSNVDRQEYLDIYRSALNKVFKSVRPSLKEETPIFPLEYGESWQKLRSTDEPTWTRMSNLIGALTEELLEDVKKASAEEAAFLHYMEQENTIKELKEEKLRSFDRELKRLDCEIERQTAELGNYERRVAPLREDRKEAEAKRNQLEKVRFKPFSVDSKEAPALGYFDETSSLDDHCDEYHAYLEENAIKHCSNQLGEYDLFFILTELKKALRSGFVRMSHNDWCDYADDPSPPGRRFGVGSRTYSGSTWFGDEDAKKSDHEQAVHTFCAALKKCAGEVVAGFLKAVAKNEVSAIGQRLAPLREQLKRYDEQIDAVSRKIESHQEERVELFARRKIFESQSKEDLAAARMFVHRFREALNDECMEHLRKVNDPLVPAEHKVLELAYVHCLTGEVNAKITVKGW